MKYRVVPFIAKISISEGTEVAANQLQGLINTMANDGWEYMRLENIETIVRDPGSKGCFGIGAIPSSQSATRYDMAVFRKED